MRAGQGELGWLSLHAPSVQSVNRQTAETKTALVCRQQSLTPILDTGHAQNKPETARLPRPILSFCCIAGEPAIRTNGMIRDIPASHKDADISCRLSRRELGEPRSNRLLGNSRAPLSSRRRCTKHHAKRRSASLI